MEIKLNFSSYEMTEFLNSKGYLFDMVPVLNYDQLSGETNIVFENIAYKSSEENPVSLGLRDDILLKKYGLKSQFEKEIKIKLLN